MERDDQFEVQYLLSLMIVVLALLTSKQLNGLLVTWVGVLFLFASSIHLILLTTHYTFEKATAFSMPSIRRIQEFSKWTLRVTTAGFIYLISHSLFRTLANKYARRIYGVSSESVQSVITFGVPILPILLITGAFIRRILPSLQASKDISITVIPREVKVYQSFDGGKPVLIEIENTAKKSRQLQLRTDSPKMVSTKLLNEGSEFDTSDNISLEPQSRKPINLKLRHNSEQQQIVRTRIEVIHEDGKYTQEVECYLRV